MQRLDACRNIKSGEELFWDYNAKTDDHRDPMLKIKCICGGCKKGTALVELEKKTVVRKRKR